MMTLLEWAQAYCAQGWAVFPTHALVEGVCTCGTACGRDAGKHPRTANGVKDGSHDLEQVMKWFGPGSPPSNLAICTGAVSGLTVLDVDMGEGKVGAETWAALIEGYGEPQTLHARTGGGGIHFLFAYSPGLKTSSNTLGTHVDCRNDNGYIIAPPSNHKSGESYAWLNWGSAVAALPVHLAVRKETRGRKRREDAYKGRTYSIEQVVGMLAVIPSDDRDVWLKVGVILGRTFARSDAAWAAYVTWADTWTGTRLPNHDKTMHTAFYVTSQQRATGVEATLGTIIHEALKHGWAPKRGEVPASQFVYYGPGNNYLYRPTGSEWIAHGVDAAVSPVNEDGVIVKASVWLETHALCTSITCDPALEEDYLKGMDCRNGEVLAMPGAALFNKYRPPSIELGDARLAGPFTDHVALLFNKPGDAHQFLCYMAHRVQRPWEKPRFALLIAGGQGTGKDTAIEFCVPAIGSWNVSNIDPSAFESGFNEFASSVLIRVSETSNHHEMSKWAFNERTKVLIAGLPDYAIINPKYGQKFSVRMFCGVIMTTNNLAQGIFIPPDDRRYDVMDTATLAQMGLTNVEVRRQYFEKLWAWFLDGGAEHIAAYLSEFDLGSWSASSGQRKTAAHKTVVSEGSSADEWLWDILETLGEPDVVRTDWIESIAEGNGMNLVNVRKMMGHALGRANFVKYPNPDNERGRWPFPTETDPKRKCTVFVKVEMVHSKKAILEAANKDRFWGVHI